MKHSLVSDKKHIAYHYDVSNDFYKLFLGKGMVYSCALFKHGNENIDEAQENKMDYICRKLRLQKNERLLDIGCGWGGLIAHAAKNYGVHALGITLSPEQYHYTKHYIREQGLSDRCRVELRNYRELEGEACFEKIVSVGMFEHVGKRNFQRYFLLIKKLLKERGLFLNHNITIAKKKVRRTRSMKFMNMFVFPGAELSNIGSIQCLMEQVGFEILDVESLRTHYAKTLKCWAGNLLEQKDKAIQIVDEKMYRIWTFYMVACSNRFEKGTVNVYQVLVSKRSKEFSPVPLTRSDLYF